MEGAGEIVGNGDGDLEPRLGLFFSYSPPRTWRTNGGEQTSEMGRPAGQKGVEAKNSKLFSWAGFHQAPGQRPSWIWFSPQDVTLLGVGFGRLPSRIQIWDLRRQTGPNA